MSPRNTNQRPARARMAAMPLTWRHSYFGTKRLMIRGTVLLEACSNGPVSCIRFVGAPLQSSHLLHPSGLPGGRRTGSGPLDPLVAEPAPVHLAHEPRHAGRVGHGAGGVAVVELGQVAGQVLTADVVVGAVDRPLQLTEVPLGQVGRGSVDRVNVLVVGVEIGRAHV